MISGGGGDAGGDADGDAECDVSLSRLFLLFWLLFLPLVACAYSDPRVVVFSLVFGCLIAFDLGLLASTYMSVASVSSLMLASSCFDPKSIFRENVLSYQALFKIHCSYDLKKYDLLE